LFLLLRCLGGKFCTSSLYAGEGYLLVNYTSWQSFILCGKNTLQFRTIEFLDFVHHPVVKKYRRTRCFGNWICFHPQVRGWETVRFFIKIDGGSKGPNRVRCFHPLTWGWREIQFPKSCVL
jgi:hypothetical protein